MLFFKTTLILLHILLLLLNVKSTVATENCPIDVALIGATGNLAQKYLWTSLFRLSKDIPLRVYPGSRDVKEKGQKKVDRILSSNINCDGENCAQDIENFEKNVVRPYVRVKTTEHYAELHKIIEKDVESTCSSGRLFYLAVPPSAYASIANAINTLSRPSQGWLRVVFEKPFGSDYDSALKMADDLSSALTESEIYRIDHYLGKQALQGLPGFLSQNRETLGRIMNNHYVKRIEIAMMETEDCEGRTGFYDKYGVIRDVFQNHLSEMLALILSDLPVSPKTRLESLRHVHIDMREITIGQYHEYQSHVDEDRKRWDEEDVGKRTVTPTCALVKVVSNQERWNGVPIYLYSGKAAYPRKRGMIRVDFRNGGFLQFVLQGKPHGAGLVEYENLPGKAKDMTLSSPGLGWHKIKRGFQVDKKRNAYDVLVEKALRGQSEHFVSTDRLMESWSTWTPVLNLIADLEPEHYIKNENRAEICHPPSGLQKNEL